VKNYSLLIFHLKQSGFFQNSSRSLQSDLGFYYSSKYAWKVSFVWMAHPHFGQLTSQILPEVFETTEGLLKRFDRSSSFKEIFSLHSGHSIINIFIITVPNLSERIYDAPWLGSLCDGAFWGDNSTTQRSLRAFIMPFGSCVPQTKIEPCGSLAPLFWPCGRTRRLFPLLVAPVRLPRISKRGSRLLA
jgi:hypothetical protein